MKSSSPLVYGWLTPELNRELKRLLQKAEWPPPEEPTPEFSAVIQVCDYAFRLSELKAKCDEMGVSKSGDKKILIGRLLNVGEEEVTEIAQKTADEIEARGLAEAEISTEKILDIARKVAG